MVIYQRPLLIPLLAMVIGLILNDQTGFTVPLSLVIASGVVLFLSSFIASRTFFSFFVYLFFFVWGCHALSYWKQPAVSPNFITNFVSQNHITIEGIVESRMMVVGERTSFILKSQQVVGESSRQPVVGRLMVYVASGNCLVSRGDRIRFVARIAQPHILGLPGEFDFTRYLAFQGVYATAQVANGSGLVIMQSTAEAGFIRKCDDMAQHLSHFIQNSIHNKSVSAVLIAVLVGDQKQIPNDLNRAYTRAGVNHILSISGFHIGIIAYSTVMLILFVLTRFEYLVLKFNLRRMSLLCALPAMLWYLFITGAAPATSRSVIMLIALALALYSERETDGINMLLIAAVVLIVGYPPSLFDISLQLSFIALWGILVFTTPLVRVCGRLDNYWFKQLITFLAASISASAVTAVPVLYVFHQASLNGVLSNFVIVPLLGYGAVILGFLALVLSYIYTPFATLLLNCAGWLTEISNTLVYLFASLPVVQFHSLTIFDIGLFLVWLCCATFIHLKKIRIILCSFIPLLAISCHLFASGGADGKLHLTMLSVGQGESMLLRTPTGECFLIDGGGYLFETDKDFGERTLVPALFKLGVKRLDGVLLTHSHPDHLGGLPYLLENMPVTNIWETSTGGVGAGYERLQVAIKRQKIRSNQLSAGMTIQLSPQVSLHVLSPSKKEGGSSYDDTNMNEQSLVFRLIYEDFSMLFTADAGFRTEEQLLSLGENLKATVLKVGHHGSRYSTSEEFIKKVSPSIALISAGYGNRFGLPASDTIDLLHKQRVIIYRTDLDGTIELETDGKKVNVQTPFKENLNYR